MTLLSTLLRLVAERAADRVTHEVKTGLSPVAPYLRRLSSGIALVVVSALAWFMGLLFLLLSFFFSLMDNMTYSFPALYTGLVAWVLALILALLGMNLLRKPR